MIFCSDAISVAIPERLGGSAGRYSAGPFFDLKPGIVQVRFLASISSGWIPATSPTRCPGKQT